MSYVVHRTPSRAASVPAGHPYVRHIAHSSGSDEIVRLPDPTDPWWPPTMLDVSWIREHADDFDLMHVHFGFDGVAPEALDRVGRELGLRGKPLVVTVHDLRNPHHPTPTLHQHQLGALLRHASAVITLTDDAARTIAALYGRQALVLPHPHIVELEDLRRRQAHLRPETTTVGIHLKSIRPNMETAVVDAAVDAVKRVPGSLLRVDVHLDVALPDGQRHDLDLMTRLHAYQDAGNLTVVTHDYFDEREFVDYLESLRASVLPYRFGTHSGWLEACRDLGVAVVAPDCGSYHDQGDVFSFCCNESDGLDAPSCTAAIEHALRAARPDPVPWRERAQQRHEIATQHRDLYRLLLDDVRTPPRPPLADRSSVRRSDYAV